MTRLIPHVLKKLVAARVGMGVLCLAMAATQAWAGDRQRQLVGPDVEPASLEMKSNTDRQSYEFVDGGLLVTITPGEKATPTLFIKPTEGSWNLAEYGHITATITNLDQDEPLRIHMRVDNAGNWQDKPWNTEVIRVLPGKTQPLKVIFGHHYGYKPGFKLDPSKVEKVALFIEHPEETYSYRIESIVAGGDAGEMPEVKPEAVRTKPAGGVILGSETKIGQSLKLSAKHGTIEAADGAVTLLFPGGKDDARAAVRPPVGRWNLNDHLQVQVTLTNTGSAEVAPRFWLESNKGPSDEISPEAPIQPGQTATVTIPFRGIEIWEGPQELETKPFKGTKGTTLASNVVSGLLIAPGEGDGEVSLRLDGIVAGMPEPTPRPDWLGKRPPVDGDWTMTFDENFDSSIDPDVWNIYTANYWDKKSHFSKDNVIMDDGVVQLRFEKKTGHHNDDPEAKVTDYATGFLDTYGKWVQRYGYFESRMKLPTAPGLWPAFWLMPDRGVEAGPQWKRADTGNSGMEFDIMEYLSRWGANRFTTAFHWDGYKDNHKATGTPMYFAPDEDGFVTVGLLWLPGEAVIYVNGEAMAKWQTPRISSVESYIIFTAVSGGWDNDPIDDALLPSDFVVDYVRAWQRADLASAVDGPREPQ